MVGGLIIKNRKEEGFFCKRTKRVEGPFWKKRKIGGAQGKIALLPPLSRTEQGRGIGAAAVLIPAAWGLGGGSGVREKREGKERIRSPASPRAGAE